MEPKRSLGGLRRWLRRIASGLVAAVLLSVQSCCGLLSASGGGPLAREELGDWAGMARGPAPDAYRLEAKLAELKAIPHPSFSPFRGEYSYTEGPHWLSTAIPDPWDFPFAPVRGYRVAGTFPLWRRAIPCTREGHFVYHDPTDPARREFYAHEEAWGCGLFIGDFIWSAQRVRAYDVATGQQVAAKAMDCVLGWGVGWSRLRQVLPVGADGSRGLHALADPAVALSEIRYDVRDGNALLLGLVGWGRVNRCRYIQVLWVPIPAGKAAACLRDGHR